MNIIAIVQARIGSVRMPKKSSAPIGKDTAITFLQKRLINSKMITESFLQSLTQVVTMYYTEYSATLD